MARADESLEGEPLLRPVMRGGEIVPGARESLQAPRERARRALDRLPTALRSLAGPPGPPPVRFSAELEHDLRALRADHAPVAS